MIESVMVRMNERPHQLFTPSLGNPEWAAMAARGGFVCHSGTKKRRLLEREGAMPGDADGDGDGGARTLTPG